MGIKNIVHTSTSGLTDQEGGCDTGFLWELYGLSAKYFANVDFYHWQVFDRSLLEENPPDAAIYLIVERESTVSRKVCG